MREEDTYKDIGLRFVKLLQGLHPDWEIAFSENKFLPQMIEELERLLNGKTDYHDQFCPHLKLDILIGVKTPHSTRIGLILLEIKLGPLTSIHHSQLLGYLMCAPNIHCGILFSVLRDLRHTYMSSEYQEVLNMRLMPMSLAWTTESSDTVNRYKMGIGYYQYQSMIKWHNSGNECISSFHELANYIEETIAQS